MFWKGRDLERRRFEDLNAGKVLYVLRSGAGERWSKEVIEEENMIVITTVFLKGDGRSPEQTRSDAGNSDKL